MISNYESFIDSFVKPSNMENFFKDINLTLDLAFIKIDSKLYERIKKREYDFFEAMEGEFLAKKDKKNILIIDEIQTLEDIYINGDRLLLNEFLNFCVALTKETHSSHVLILTSNTIFLNKIYNNSKLKVTSKFKLINHLEYEEIKEWLKTKKFNEEEIDLIYDYLGGSTAHIKKLLEDYKYFNSIKEYLEEEAEIAKNEIEFSFRDLRKKDKEYLIEPFEDIIKDIIKNGYSKRATKKHDEAIEYFCDIEILFFDPLKNLVKANSKIYVKAFELLLKRF